MHFMWNFEPKYRWTCIWINATDMEVIEQAIRNGYTSVMFDGSQLPFDDVEKEPDMWWKWPYHGISVMKKS